MRVGFMRWRTATTVTNTERVPKPFKKNTGTLSIMEKNALADKIRHWLEYDKKITDLQKQMRELKKHKKIVADDLSTLMKEREVDTVSVSNVGQISYQSKEVKKGINKKYLVEILLQYFKDPSQAKEVSDYILENRETQTRENIKLKK